MGDKPFSIDLGRLRSREKDRSPAAVERADRAGEELGFVDREPSKRRGRKPSPRTGQVHAKVLPPVADEIAAAWPGVALVDGAAGIARRIAHLTAGFSGVHSA